MNRSKLKISHCHRTATDLSASPQMSILVDISRNYRQEDSGIQNNRERPNILVESKKKLSVEKFS